MLIFRSNRQRESPPTPTWLMLVNFFFKRRDAGSMKIPLVSVSWHRPVLWLDCPRGAPRLGEKIGHHRADLRAAMKQHTNYRFRLGLVNEAHISPLQPLSPVRLASECVKRRRRILHLPALIQTISIPTLDWDPADFGGLERTYIPADKIMLPIYRGCVSLVFPSLFCCSPPPILVLYIFTVQKRGKKRVRRSEGSLGKSAYLVFTL